MSGEIILDQRTILANQAKTQEEIQALQLRIMRAQADKAEEEVNLTRAKTKSILNDISTSQR